MSSVIDNDTASIMVAIVQPILQALKSGFADMGWDELAW